MVNAHSRGFIEKDDEIREVTGVMIGEMRLFMNNTAIDSGPGSAIMTPEEVALYLHKSLSWIYRNWQMLGGVKLGGSLFFPRKEDLYERLFRKRQGVEIRFHPRRAAMYGCLVQDQAGGKERRGQKKGGNNKTIQSSGNPNRHGLLGVGESKT
jgi:hypothetical protein